MSLGGAAEGIVVGQLAAGPAGAAIGAVKAIISEIIGTLESGFTKVKAIVQDTVAAFRPIELELFTRAVNDLRAAVGTILLPVMQEITAIVRQLADYVYSLPDSFKSLIRNFAEIALVVGAATIVITTLATAFASLIVGLGLLASPIGLVVAGIAAVAYVMSQTEGGLRFFRDTLRYVEQGIAAIKATLLYAWEQVQPLWEKMKAAFSELGDALSELQDALEPLRAAGFAVIGIVVTTALKLIIEGLTLFAKAITRIAQLLAAGLAPFQALGLSLPNVERDQKSARGLGTHGGNVTDLLGSFRQIQEAILNFASDAEAKKNDEEQREAIKQTAKNTSIMADKLEEVAAYLIGGVVGGPQLLKKWRAGRP